MDNNQNKQASSFASLMRINRATRVGSWTVAMTLILLAVLVVVNLLFSALPSTWTKLDASSTKIYTIGKTTEKYVSSLTRDVELVVVSPSETPTTLQVFLERYASLSSHISVDHVDPIANPTFLKNYDKIQGSGNYIVVKSDLRYTVVDISAMEYIYLTDLQTSVTVDQYSQIMADTTTVNMYYQYYGVDLTKYTAYFGGEQQITSAIEYVSTEKIPHLYMLAGHGDKELPSAILEEFANGLLEYETLTLQGDAGVPELASGVIVYDPVSDLTEAEYEALAAFVDKGGNLLLFTSPACATMTNLMRLMEKVGLSATAGGNLYEGNANAYLKQPTVLVPKVNTEYYITSVLYSSGYTTLAMPNAHGIVVAATLPENVTVTKLLTTSDAYVPGENGTTTDYGAVAIAAAAENSKTGAKVIWFSSTDAFTDTAISTYGSAAVYYAHVSAAYLNDAYASALTGLEAVDLTEEPLTVPAMTAFILGGILAVIVPVVIVISGIVVWARRRKR